MSNEDEIRFWNRRGGEQWGAKQHLLDTLFREITEHLLGQAAVATGEHVIDVGCGNGDTTLALARRVGDAGSVTALDVSTTLLDDARNRLAGAAVTNVHLVEADAQLAALALHADAIVSRFGVMFFSDPVAAFANLRAHANPGGRLAFAAWGEIEDNPWFAAPLDAAVAQLGSVAPRNPRKPGPTAFGDSAYVRRILVAAGWSDIDIASHDVGLHIAGSAADAAELASGLGPVSRVYRDYPPTEADRTAIVERVRAVFERGEHDGGTRVPAHIHFVRAVNAA
ncbi:MAG: class I SAM-dependent methyltransferase [Pseudomonadota bacterium]